MIAVDSHVHLHPKAEIKAFFDRALANLSRFAPEASSAILGLADYAGAEGFKRLVECTQSGANQGTWQLNLLNEGELEAHYKDGFRIICLAGNQCVSSEGVELLTLGKSIPMKSRQPLDSMIDITLEQGALPVLPWGVGKWLGKRGSIISNLIEQRGQDIWLGDNGGRMPLWNPNHFSLASKANVPCLPGSDPLRTLRDCYRAGSYGFVVDAEPPNGYVSSWLCSYLRDRGPVKPFGRTVSTLQFFVNQIEVRL